MAAKTLTIEVGNEFIKISEMQNSKKMVMVHHAISVQTPSDSVEDGFVKDINLVSDTIKNAMAEEQITAKEVTFVINSSRVSAKEVVLPVVKKEAIQDYLDMNITDYFPINIEDYVVSYTVLESVDTKTEKKSRVLVFAAPEKMVQSYYELAKYLGMKVTAVDSAVNSTLQLIKLQIDAKPTLVVQLGIDTTIVSVMNDNILQLQRTLPYGESLLINSVMDSKKVSAKVAMELLSQAKMLKSSLDGDELTGSLKYLLSNVNRVIEYYSGRNQNAPLQKVVIIGEGADVLGMDELFSNETSLPTESLTLLKNVESYNRIKVSSSLLKQYMANIGASLDPIHLVPKNLTGSTKGKKAGTGSSAVYYLGSAVVIVIAAFLFLQPKLTYSGLENDRDDLNSSIKKASSIRTVIADYYEAEDKYVDLKSYYTSTINDTDWTPEFVELLEKVSPSDMRYSSLSISSGQASINATCKSKAEISALIQKLTADKHIVAYRVSSITEAAPEIVSFIAEVRFVCDDTVEAISNGELVVNDGVIETPAVDTKKEETTKKGDN